MPGSAYTPAHAALVRLLAEAVVRAFLDNRDGAGPTDAGEAGVVETVTRADGVAVRTNNLFAATSKNAASIGDKTQ